MASKIKVDQIAESTLNEKITFQNDVIVPTGKTITIADGVPVASGGTSLTSFTAGDVLYATGPTTLAKLPKGTAEQVLAMNSGGTAPDWGSVDLTVLPTISAAKGGTGQAGGFTNGDILYATDATTLAKLPRGSASQQLRMNAGATAPEWVTPASGGKLGQILQVTKTDTATYAVYAEWHDIPDMTIDITPTATNSKVLITCALDVGGQSGSELTYRLVRDGSVIFQADTAGYRARGIGVIKSGGTTSQYLFNTTYLDSPSKDTSTNYHLEWFSEYSGNQPHYINRSQHDYNHSPNPASGFGPYDYRGASSMQAWEILA